MVHVSWFCIKVCIFGYYKKFKSQFANIDRLSLTNRREIKKKKGDPNKLVWEDEHGQRIFERLKGCMVSLNQLQTVS